jgi:ATP-dependent Lon protease
LTLKRGGRSKKTFPSFISNFIRPEGDTFETLTLLPLRELVLYPNTVVPIFVTVQPGIIALEEALRRDNRLFAACLRKRDPASELYEPWPVGTVVRIMQHLRLPDNTFRVVLQGEYRGKILDMEERGGYTLVKIEPIDSAFGDLSLPEDVALLRAVQRSFTQYAELSKKSDRKHCWQWNALKIPSARRI